MKVSPQPIAVIGLLALITACSSDKKFSASPATKSVAAVKTADADPAPSTTTKTETKTQEYDLKTIGTPIDMLWVIDNSGSMNEEVTQVRKNFESFMTTISNSADLHLTLLSATEQDSPQFGVTLSSAAIAAGHMQIPYEVASNNLIDLAASSICDQATTDVPTSGQITAAKVCGIQGTASGQGGANAKNVNNVRGLFKPRLRDGAKRVIVFVTDDDTRFVLNSDNFLSAAALDPMNTTVFAFRGDQSKSGCQITRKGSTYDNLAKATNGAVFDICDSDWSANFTALSNSVLHLAAKSFMVPDKNGKIVKISIDGVDLSPDQYTLDADNRVTLKDDAQTAKNGKLVITYDVTETVTVQAAKK